MRTYRSRFVLSLLALGFLFCVTPATAEEPATGIEVENFADLFANHFKCYSVVSDWAEVFDVRLLDQFKESHGRTFRPLFLCNPVSKNGGEVPNPEYHLVCFELQQDQDPVLPTVQTFNQFGDQKLEPIESKMLCLPSKKIHL